MGNGRSSRLAGGVWLRRRCKPAGPVRLVRGQRRQARPRPAGTWSGPTWSVRLAWEPVEVDAQLVRRLRYEAGDGSAGTQWGLVPRARWRRVGQRRGDLPDGGPLHDRPDVRRHRHRRPPGPESAWTCAGGGEAASSEAIGRRHAGSATEPRPERPDGEAGCISPGKEKGAQGGTPCWRRV